MRKTRWRRKINEFFFSLALSVVQFSYYIYIAEKSESFDVNKGNKRNVPFRFALNTYYARTCHNRISWIQARSNGEHIHINTKCCAFPLTELLSVSCSVPFHHSIYMSSVLPPQFAGFFNFFSQFFFFNSKFNENDNILWFLFGDAMQKIKMNRFGDAYVF